MHPVPEGIRRLSIHAGAVSTDVVLSAVVSVELLIPAIIDALDVRPGRVAVRWRLSAAGGTALDASKTLNELGIRDGSTLVLTSSSTEFAAPRSDDAAEAVSSVVAAVECRWTRRSAQLVGVLVASLLSAVSAAVLLRAAFDVNAGHRAGCLVIAVAVSLASLVATAAADRALGQHGAGLALGLIASGFATLAGLFAVPGGPSASNALFGAAAAATSAAVIHLIGCHATVFATLGCFATTCVIAAGVCVLTDAPLSVIGTGLAALSLAMVEASPSASVLLARLSPDTPIADSDQLRPRTIRAHTWLTGLVASFSASGALGAVGALLGTSPPRVTFATAIGGLLLLRSRTHHDLGRSAMPVVCGVVTLGAVLVAVAAAYPGYTLAVAGVSMALGFLALYLGFIGSVTVPSPAGRRIVERVELLAFAAVVPLTLWLCGLFGAARSVNLS